MSSLSQSVNNQVSKEVQPIVKDAHRVKINGKTYEMTLISPKTQGGGYKIHLTEEAWETMAGKVKTCMESSKPYELANNAKNFEIQLETNESADERAPDAKSTSVKKIRFYDDASQSWKDLKGDQVTAFQKKVCEVFNDRFLENVLKNNYIKLPKNAISSFPDHDISDISTVPSSFLIEERENEEAEDSDSLEIVQRRPELIEPIGASVTELPSIPLIHVEGTSTLLYALALSQKKRIASPDKAHEESMRDFSGIFNLKAKKVLKNLKIKINKINWVFKKTENDQYLIKKICQLIYEEPLDLKKHIEQLIKNTEKSLTEKQSKLPKPRDVSAKSLKERLDEIEKIKQKLSDLNTFNFCVFSKVSLGKKLKKLEIKAILNVLLSDLNIMPTANYQYKNCFLPLYLRLYLEASDSSSDKSPRFLVLIAKPHGSENYTPDTRYLTMMQTGSNASEMTADNTDVIVYDPDLDFDDPLQKAFTLDRTNKELFQKLIDHVKQKRFNIPEDKPLSLNDLEDK